MAARCTWKDGEDLALWERFKSGRFDVYLSYLTIDDCTHIGVALSNQLDYIVSWNFKHMVNVKTVNGVRAISILNGYKTIDLVSPTYFLEEE